MFGDDRIRLARLRRLRLQLLDAAVLPARRTASACRQAGIVLGLSRRDRGLARRLGRRHALRPPAADAAPGAARGRHDRRRSISGPLALLLVQSESVIVAYVFNFIFQLFSPFWIGSAIALANELVMPRMRATASAYYILAVTFIGLALGPYTIGPDQRSPRQGGRTRAAMRWAPRCSGASSPTRSASSSCGFEPLRGAGRSEPARSGARPGRAGLRLGRGRISHGPNPRFAETAMRDRCRHSLLLSGALVAAFAAASPALAGDGDPTFYRDVLPILQESCKCSRAPEMRMRSSAATRSNCMEGVQRSPGRAPAAINGPLEALTSHHFLALRDQVL